VILAAALLLAGCARQAEAADPPGDSARTAARAATESAADPNGRGGQAPIHPAYSLTAREFEALIADLPEPARDSALSDPAAFLEDLRLLHDDRRDLLRLVDKSHPLPAEYEPDDLVELDTLANRLDLSRAGHRLRAVVLPDLFSMVDDARGDGVTLLISSAYRSYDYQVGIYNYWVEELGQEEADRTSARPGTSQHQLGTVIDFGCICDEFADSTAGRWMAQNAWRYGFSLSYPDGFEWMTGYTYESWHYRYIGKVAARMARTYFDGIQQRFIEFANGKIESFWSFLIEF
jgi:D-alanyl-D-alanine carboxypeptidase